MDTNAQVQEGILSEPSMESEPPFGRWRPEAVTRSCATTYMPATVISVTCRV
jgi:hypothetical protein